ncbi:hypothetical protein [Paenibacillus harenae]|uniref:hypothetical protein n=1 Tax=Paenibacillus harenae TaxID=306543 RepID=UPI0027910827|nr:hypothetical protein [Paenibacillus harenae]MDQ0058223.1 hypothetical protein [Paenibacillus harenae]
MRLSGFIVGGLVGAVATMYVSRKRPGTFAWATSAVSKAASNMMGNTVSKVMNKGFMNEAAGAVIPKHTDAAAGKSEAAWEQIEAIVNSDPAIKKEADKIKAESSAFTH